MRIFHIALRVEWEAARRTGSYAGSTRGRTLAEVGYVHCSRADQWQRVREVVYADVTAPLVLLMIDTDRLDVPVVEEPGSPDSDEHFPHVYGAIPLTAVLDVTPIASPGAPPTDPAHGRSFRSLLMTDICVRIALGIAVMLVSGILGTVAEATLGQPSGLLAALAALVVGTLAAVTAYRRWDRRAR